RLLHAIDPEINMMDCIDSVEESVKFLESGNNPDLIFMDIQLSDGLSFEIFDRTRVSAPVIFTTAFDDYAIKAFKVNSIDYLLKPVEQEDLARAISKFRKTKTKEGGFFSREQLEEVLGLYRPAYKSRLVVKLGDKIRHIEANEIAYFFSEDKVSFLVTNETKKYIINYTLEQIEKFMNPADFYRLNRKYVAHINAIETIDKYFNSRLKIGLKPEVEDDVLISRNKVSDFLNWLER
ncbi:MAG: response regulator transcription factor, partial [Bacteroidales bacterium]|nr:response regulator transcription factor [Bacteroidales bacterium]